MTQSMIEKVAKAIQEHIPGWLREDGTVNDEHLAIAAIEAMREPTEAMEWVGDDAHDPHVRNASEIWQAMIDAALLEQQP